MSVFQTVLAGLPAVTLEDEWLRVTVLAGKGADVVELTDKLRGLDLTWRSPTGIRHPATVSPGAAADDVAAFLDTYPGGWQEILPNGGAPSVYRGARLPQHGEVATVPWAYEVVDEHAVRFSVSTRRLPLSLLKVMRLRTGVLEIDEELLNEALVPLDVMWGHHITFGEPFLRPGAKIRLPDGISVIPHPVPIHPSGRRRVAPGGPYRWPVVPGTDLDTVDLSVIPEPGTPSDIVYLTGFEDIGWYEVSDPRGGAGLRVEWDATVLPYLWLWQEFGATTDYPWWGRAFVVGLEPFSSYPTDGLAAAVANGTALRLAAGGRRRLRLTARPLGVIV
ncbi:MAG TPA: DUF4432 family protein [Natronosporangium sp.]